MILGPNGLNLLGANSACVRSSLKLLHYLASHVKRVKSLGLFSTGGRALRFGLRRSQWLAFARLHIAESSGYHDTECRVRNESSLTKCATTGRLCPFFPECVSYRSALFPRLFEALQHALRYFILRLFVTVVVGMRVLKLLLCLR